MRYLFPSAFDFNIKDIFSVSKKEPKQNPVPVKFKHSNVVFAEKQPEYIPLPVYKYKDGTVVSCWSFNLWNRLRILFTGKIYLSQLTFNYPLQPIRPHMDFEWDKLVCENCGDLIIDHKHPTYYCPKAEKELNNA